MDGADLKIVEGGNAFINGITSISYGDDANGIVVTTRFPSNLFVFASGESIAIEGIVAMRLAGDTSSRKLRALSGANSDDVEETTYKIKIDLQEDELLGDSLSRFSNTGSAIALGKIMAMVVIAFAW